MHATLDRLLHQMRTSQVTIRMKQEAEIMQGYKFHKVAFPELEGQWRTQTQTAETNVGPACGQL